MSEKDTKSNNVLVFGPRTQEIQRAIRDIVDYVEIAERKDYESNPRSGHIYESVKVLRESLAEHDPRLHEADDAAGVALRLMELIEIDLMRKCGLKRQVTSKEAAVYDALRYAIASLNPDPEALRLVKLQLRRGSEADRWLRDGGVLFADSFGIPPLIAAQLADAPNAAEAMALVANAVAAGELTVTEGEVLEKLVARFGGAGEDE